MPQSISAKKINACGVRDIPQGYSPETQENCD